MNAFYTNPSADDLIQHVIEFIQVGDKAATDTILEPWAEHYGK